MKQTLKSLTMAVLTLSAIPAFAQSSPPASPPPVTITGYLDVGVMVSKSSGKAATIQEAGGLEDASRIILVGVEPLNADTRVMFFLESDFDINNGARKDINGDGVDAMFNAQSTLAVINDRFGEFGMGRLYAFNSTPGKTGWTIKMDAMNTFLEASLFGTSGFSNVSNAAYWISPRTSFGLQGGLLFSINGSNTKEAEGAFSKNNRFWNAALNYESSKAQGILSLAGTMMGSGDHAKDPFQLRIGGNYNFDLFKLYAGYTYHKNNTRLSVPSPEYLGAMMSLIHDPSGNGKGVDTHAFNIGFHIPVGKSFFMGQYQYMTGKVKNPLISQVVFEGKDKIEKSVYSLGYKYFFSKRTHLYAIGAYADGKKGLTVDKTSNRWLGMLGIGHNF